MNRIEREQKPELKSLRWLANMFPLQIPAQDDNDRLCNAIHLYCTAGADKLEAQELRIQELEVELQEAHETIDNARDEIKDVEKNYDHLADMWAQVPPMIQDMVKRICDGEFEREESK